MQRRIIAFIFQAHPGKPPQKGLLQQPGQLKSGGIKAQPFRTNIRNTVALRLQPLAMRLPG